MKSLLYIASCIAAALATPMAWTPEMAAFYSASSAGIFKERTIGLQNPQNCDLSTLNITEYLATIPDSPPIKDPGKAKLVQVTIGRGIQNYTCADNKESTKPVLLGAVANLYNVSCVAVNHPEVLTVMSMFAVQYDTSLTNDGKLPGTNIPRSGHHFFNAAKAPVFDLNDDKDHALGLLIADATKPDMKVDAPKSAVRGQVNAKSFQTTGAVPWLKLLSQQGTTDNLTTVYRVDTAGGQAPANCAGQPPSFSVQYAAQYWFYKTS